MRLHLLDLVLCAAPPFLEGRLPAALLRPGPGGLALWQWLALPVAAALSLTAGWLLGWVTRKALARFAARTAATWDDELVARLGGPVTLFWALAVADLQRPLLALEGSADDLFGRVLRAGFFLAVFWGVFRSVDVALRPRGDAASPGLGGRIAFFRKAAKVAVLALGLIAVLTELGFQVTSLLAGLGIGGIAVALAAQKTVENLIGSITIGMDRPFHVGDTISVDGVLGEVEAVGLRSSRLRTMDRTVVTIPNGRLADMRIESYSARDRWRVATSLGLRYGTTAAQLRQVLADLEALLRAHPAAGPDAPLVRFSEFKDSSLSIEVQAWVRAADWHEFGRIRGELYLQFMAIVEAAGTGFAFPTRTLHVESLPAPARPAAAGPP
jgi:MscS family membrane protein